jgi:hypothetical protein
MFTAASASMVMTGYLFNVLVINNCTSFLPSFLPLGATDQGKLWPPK